MRTIPQKVVLVGIGGIKCQSEEDNHKNNRKDTVDTVTIILCIFFSTDTPGKFSNFSDLENNNPNQDKYKNNNQTCHGLYLIFIVY